MFWGMLEGSLIPLVLLNHVLLLIFWIPSPDSKVDRFHLFRVYEIVFLLYVWNTEQKIKMVSFFQTKYIFKVLTISILIKGTCTHKVQWHAFLQNTFLFSKGVKTKTQKCNHWIYVCFVCGTETCLHQGKRGCERGTGTVANLSTVAVLHHTNLSFSTLENMGKYTNKKQNLQIKWPFVSTSFLIHLRLGPPLFYVLVRASFRR